jgi:crossover junction endodeoxyribonuclease RusA
VKKYEYLLPYPPSANNIWRSVGGRVLLSKQARAYRENVIAAVLSQGPPPRLAGRLYVLVYASPPDKRRRDMQNIEKALFDALEHAGVYLDDEQIDEHRTKKLSPSKPGSVVVRIFEERARP